MPVLEAVHDGVVLRRVDAITNAANEGLEHLGGVALAIARAAGPELQAASRRLAPVPTGSAKATPGYALPARWVIHAVGPVWHGGRAGEPERLASAYRSVLRVADELGVTTLAVCPLSVGVFGYPKAEGIAVMAATLRGTHTDVQRIELCGYSRAEYELIVAALARAR